MIPQKFNPHRVPGYIKAGPRASGGTPRHLYATYTQLVGRKYATSTQLCQFSFL
jgi:hypothetical protein